MAVAVHHAYRGDTRTKRLAAAALMTAAVAAGVLAHVVNPARDHWLPKCPFHELTGMWCPGCGSTRAACALAHGNVADAFRHNVLFLPALAFLVWAWLAYAARAFVPGAADARWARSPLSSGTRALWGLAIVIVVFSVVRNIPGAPAHILSS